MKKFLVLLIGNSMLVSSNLYAGNFHRTGAEILGDKAESIELQAEFFSKKTSYDDEGAELTPAENESFTVNDWTINYSRGYLGKLEGNAFLRLRSVSSITGDNKATKMGAESIGADGKFLFLSDKVYKNTIHLHLKQTFYSNKRYGLSDTLPTDEVILGDDGLETGLNYLLTYFKGPAKYGVKFGYNRPSSDLSGELVYDAQAVYSFEKYFLLGGIGGITSLKGDSYTKEPALKLPMATGNSRLFNSINRELKYIYAGLQMAVGDYIFGLKGQSSFSGNSTDTGTTVALNFRYEKAPINLQQIYNDENHIGKDDYFAQGFIEKISKSGKMFKINIGISHKIVKGVKIDVFDTDNFALSTPVATGEVVEAGSNSAIIRIIKTFKKSTIQVGHLVKAY